MANTVIALKKSATPSAAPADLANGELAINYADGKLFYKHANGTISAITSSGGNSFGTVNANNTLVVADTSGDVLTLEPGTNISIVGDAVNDKITISLKNDVVIPSTGSFKVDAVGGDEGGEIKLANAITNSVLSGDIVIDIYQNRLRFYESTGTNRGAFINLASAAAGVGTDLLASATTTDNLARSTASAAFDKANAANITADLAFEKANSANVLAFNTGIGANAWANTISSTRANASNSYAEAIGAAGNSYTVTVGAAANGWANTVGVDSRNYANSTFVKLSATSQTITGNVNIVGDLTLSGNTFVIDATRLEVDDPLIYLAANNYTSDIVDIGFIANYVNATGQNVHTGLYREHEDKMYYLFQGYDREPINNHLGALSNNMTLAVLNADLRTSNLVLGGANAILTIGAAFDKANAALPNTSGISFNGNLNFPTGNVGIGTATPSSRLEVLGDVPNSLSNLGTGDAATITITNANVGGLNRIAKTLYEIGNLPIASIAGTYTVFNAGGNIGGDLIFSTQSHVGTGVQERMRIQSTGNVLIGRTTSTVGQNVKLDVVGAINASAVLVNGSPITGGSGGGYFAGNNGEVGSASGFGDIFRVHSDTLNANVTIYSANNALAAGPITIASGKTLTIQANARVSIV